MQAVAARLGGNPKLKRLWHAFGDSMLLSVEILPPLILRTEESFVFPSKEGRGAFLTCAICSSRLCAGISVQVSPSSRVELSGVRRESLEIGRFFYAAMWCRPSGVDLWMPRRRDLLRLAAGLLASLTFATLDSCATTAAPPLVTDAPPIQLPSPAAARLLLAKGNEHFAGGSMQRPHQDLAWRRGLVQAQSPFAVIFSCIDSRVPPELVFDQGLGDLFVARTAAHTLDDLVLVQNHATFSGIIKGVS